MEEQSDGQYTEGVFEGEVNTIAAVTKEQNSCIPDGVLESQPQISLNALSGINTYHTMRVQGQINNQKVIFLIDGGSTHQCCKKRARRAYTTPDFRQIGQTRRKSQKAVNKVNKKVKFLLLFFFPFYERLFPTKN